jgi:hypothetical protein
VANNLYVGGKTEVADSNFPVIKANRTGQSANNLWSTMGLQATHTGDAGDGFGAGLLTQFQDTSGTFNLGVFGFIRDGGDYKGKFLVQNNDGTTGDDWKQNFVVEPAGNVGIGITGPSEKLHVVGNTVVTGDITSNYSDIRLKENIRPIEDALTKLDTLSGLQFDYKEADESIGYEPFRKSDVGLIAQEVEKVLPDAVSIAPFDQDGDGKSKSGDHYLTLRYERLVPLLVQAVKELSAEVKELKEKINEEE